LPNDYKDPLLNDSKKLSEKIRNALRFTIERNALSWAVVQISPAEIDRINILRASFKAMNLAVQNLSIMPQSLLIDGNRFETDLDIPYHCMIKGDSRFASIAAASILAKTHRDCLMEKLHNDFPYYGWKSNKGYPTLSHRKSILKYGKSIHHRKTFQVKIQTQLFDP